MYLNSRGLLKSKTIKRNFICLDYVIENNLMHHVFNFCNIIDTARRYYIVKHVIVCVSSNKENRVGLSTSIRVNGDTFIEIIFEQIYEIFTLVYFELLKCKYYSVCRL